jgi:hypothetical protein
MAKSLQAMDVTLNQTLGFGALVPRCWRVHSFKKLAPSLLGNLKAVAVRHTNPTNADTFVSRLANVVESSAEAMVSMFFLGHGRAGGSH